MSGMYKGEGMVNSLREPSERQVIFVQKHKANISGERMQTASCLFKAIKEGSTLTQAKRLFRFPSHEFWLKSAHKPQR